MADAQDVLRVITGRHSALEGGAAGAYAAGKIDAWRQKALLETRKLGSTLGSTFGADFFNALANGADRSGGAIGQARANAAVFGPVLSIPAIGAPLWWAGLAVLLGVFIWWRS